ncbi:uncharacterized protein [Vicugna pacos]|uniref:Uncharacterized protein n=1 Tax=Vicugna pacos TaxID=30538 RepID=A0ABM5BFL2_VICPA
MAVVWRRGRWLGKPGWSWWEKSSPGHHGVLEEEETPARHPPQAPTGNQDHTYLVTELCSLAWALPWSTGSLLGSCPQPCHLVERSSGSLLSAQPPVELDQALPPSTSPPPSPGEERPHSAHIMNTNQVELHGDRDLIYSLPSDSGTESDAQKLCVGCMSLSLDYGSVPAVLSRLPYEIHTDEMPSPTSSFGFFEAEVLKRTKQGPTSVPSRSTVLRTGLSILPDPSDQHVPRLGFRNTASPKQSLLLPSPLIYPWDPGSLSL